MPTSHSPPLLYLFILVLLGLKLLENELRSRDFDRAFHIKSYPDDIGRSASRISFMLSSIASAQADDRRIFTFLDMAEGTYLARHRSPCGSSMRSFDSGSTSSIARPDTFSTG